MLKNTGNEVSLVKLGEMVEGRFRVTAISERSVELTDRDLGIKHTIPLRGGLLRERLVTVHMRGGEPLRGNLLKSDADHLTVEVGGDLLKLRLDDVKSIDLSGGN